MSYYLLSDRIHKRAATLQTSSQHGCLVLRLMRLVEHIKSLIVPHFCGHNPPSAIPELSVVLGSQKLSNAVPMLMLQVADRHHPVDRRF
jgi:hypothetical protein